MFLLQAAIAGGAFIIALIGIALLIGIPLLTFILSAYFSNQNKKEQAQNVPVSKLEELKRSQATKSQLPKSFVIAIVIMIVLVLLGILILGLAIPNFE